jgi:hypothetical protein
MMRLSGVFRAAGVALFCGSLGMQSNQTARAASSPAAVSWLRVDPRTPTTLYVGVPGSFLKRSTDSGATWQYMPDGTVFGQYAQSCHDGADPPSIAQDSHDLYVIYQESTDPVCRNGTSGLERSTDGALSFKAVRDNSFVTLATPVLSRRLYAIFTKPSDNYLDQPPCSLQVYTLDQGASSWRSLGMPPTSGDGNPLSLDSYCPDLIDDPQEPALLYANTSPPSRSEDGGKTWKPITVPSHTPPLTDFALRDDPAVAGLALEGVSDDKSVPKGDVFLSTDHGLTWSMSLCPGGHAGACPKIVLENVFGAGARYAVYAGGIYPFHGTGPAEGRLSLGSGWPFALAAVTDMQGGRKMGDPIYARLKSGVVYKSTDAGHTWLPLAAGTLPTAKPTVPPPGSLHAGPYGHDVGKQFVAAYRKLGLSIVGYPVDEPYTVQGVLVQDFEHLRLELHAGNVVTGNLGRDAAAYIQCGMGQDEAGPCAEGLAGISGKVPQTHAADFARFVKAHGGAAVFGTPLTKVYQAKNGDRSGRTYFMQLFTRARLEWHPENSNPAYRVESGLLGTEVLRDRNWL